MKRNTSSYKAQQFLMFAGVATVLFCAVVIIPFIYGIYLTLTSWDGIAKTKPFVGLANYAEAFKDVAYWQALGRTAIYSIFAVVLINVVAFFLAYLVTTVSFVDNTRSDVLSDPRIGLAVCRLYDADLCGRFYERVGFPQRGCHDRRVHTFSGNVERHDSAYEIFFCAVHLPEHHEMLRCVRCEPVPDKR